jgi:AraC-like DNA-binding protein
MDVLSNVLDIIHLDGALFLNGDFAYPWRIASPCGADIADIAMPHTDNVIVYHLITEGGCIVQVENEENIELVEGDVVIFPQGAAHDIGSHLNSTPMDMSEIVPTLLNPNLNLIKTSGGKDSTKIVCGWLSVEQNVINPLIDSLPNVIRVNIRQQDSGRWLENSIRYAVESTSTSRAGNSAMTKKLAELLFLETLRLYIETIPETESNWLAGMEDKHVGKALSLMHESPAFSWSVETLAEKVFVSRSVLADKFKHYVGIPPMKYLARWRLAISASLLRDGNTPVASIIDKIGYESETAFIRAFKREFGVTPGNWRKQKAAAQ